MDEYKPEEELKTDLSDRPSPARRRPVHPERPPVSRQNLMIGIAVLALLVLIISLSSSLKTSTPVGQTNGTASPSAPVQPSDRPTHAGAQSQQNNSPQTIQVPPVAAEPPQPAVPAPATSPQHRLEWSGDRLGDELAPPRQQVGQDINSNAGGLPVAPAEVSPSQSANETSKSEVAAPVSRKPARTVTTEHKKPTAAPSQHVAGKPLHHKPASTSQLQPTAKKAATATSSRQYTLQLSAASRSDTLSAWAKKNQLQNYHIYETHRNGQPWYILVSGTYATAAEARRAIASLPAAVRAQQPWPKPLNQIKGKSR